MNRKPIALFASVGFALLGTLLLVNYVHTAEARATEGEKLVSVLVASETIDLGTAATTLEGRVETEKVPAKVRADGAVTSLAELGKKVATTNILPGEQLVVSRFAPPGNGHRAAAPDGLLEVTVPLTPARALGGQISAGATVAVVASVDATDDSGSTPATHLILHKVKVTSVQSTTAAPDDDKLAPTGDLLVTLAVDAPSVERIVFAAENGRLWLAAEPEDAGEGGTGIQSNGSVL